MCVNESISYSCGHSTPKVVQRCPLSTQWPETPPCTIPADRPLHVSEMCQGCVRVTWVKEVIRKEAYHRDFHEKDMCRCNEVHTEKERRRARESAAERKRAKRMGNQTMATYPGKSMIGMMPQQRVDDAWRMASYEFAPQECATGCWNGASYGTVPQQQRWESGNNGYFIHADEQWENTVTGYCQQPNQESSDCEQQNEPTYNGLNRGSLKSVDFVPHIEQGLIMPPSTSEELAISIVLDQHTVVDDQEGTGDFDQSTAVDDQTESRDRVQSTIVVDQWDVRDSNQRFLVTDRVKITHEKVRDLSPSPPVAVGSVTSSRQSSPTHPAVQEMAANVDIQPALLKLSVIDALDNAKSPP